MTGPLSGLRVDHIGSLVNPPELKAAYQAFDEGRMTEEALREVQDRAVREVIARQETIGLPLVTDGEFRRRGWQESFSGSVTGFDAPDGAKEDLTGVTREPFQRAEQDFDAPGPAIGTRRPVRERLRLVRNVPLEEYRASSALATVPVKVTVLTPDRVLQRFRWEDSREIYRDLDEFGEDVVAIDRAIVAGLVDAGCRYIQVDAPSYTAYVDGLSLERMRARGEDPARNLERAIQMDNAVIDGFPGVTFGIHICRGNARTVDPVSGRLLPQWHREGHYDAIAERLFNELHHDRLLLEYDSDRAGGFEPLRYVPAGKIAVLGLVSTKSNEVETVDGLRRRIEEAADHAPLERLALSPQCGFGGGSHLTVTLEEQWAKLARILETARLTWG